MPTLAQLLMLGVLIHAGRPMLVAEIRERYSKVRGLEQTHEATRAMLRSLEELALATSRQKAPPAAQGGPARLLFSSTAEGRRAARAIVERLSGLLGAAR